MDPDPDKAWLVDFRIGYRCKALEHAQQVKAAEDRRVEEAGAKTYPGSRKWTATEYREGPDHGGQDSHSPVHS